VLETERDIDDEGRWHIIEDRDTTRKTRDMQRLGQSEMERVLDLNRQAKEYDEASGRSTFQRTGGADDES